VGLLASMAVPQFGKVQQRAFNSAALADLHNAMDEIERYYNEHFEYPGDEQDLYDEGYAHTPGVEFLKFSIRDGSNLDLTRVHMHIAHAGSLHYYHYEYPEGYAGVPEKRWK
jgi:Tfp pilus assembly protein PilE